MATENPYSTPEGELVSDVGEYGSTAIFSGSTRIGRARLLARYMLGYFSIYFLFGILVAVIGAASMNENIFAASTGTYSLLPFGILIVFCFLLAVQRLHDLNQSGWLVLLIFIPLAGLFFVLYLMFAPGTKGSNNYGPPPPPNTVGIWLAALLFPIIIVIGIAAAIALPAYQDYMERAQQQLEQQVEE